MTKQISIIGCGWLGLPTAEYFIGKGYSIKGTTTSTDKMALLKSAGIDSYSVKLSDGQIEGDVAACLSNSTTLILNIPPGLRKDSKKDFVGDMALLLPFIEQSTIKQLLFISSTSVYADDESLPIITETMIPDPDTASGSQLLAAEALFKKSKHFDTTILRFAGLIGPDRHPATFLSGKNDLKNPDAPVNLIHRIDCIQIMYNIIHGNHWNQTYNASSSPHPTRSDYYTSICRSRGLPIPKFRTTSISIGKQINSNRLIEDLNYEFEVKLNN